MISRLLMSTLLALPLCAQAAANKSAPAVRILMQVDSPPAGVPNLDTAEIANALKSFDQQQGFLAPAQDGDGWILGIHLTPVKSRGGVLIAKVFLRVSHLQKGQVVPEGAKDAAAIIAADDPAHWAQALVGEAWELLSASGVVASRPVITQRDWKKLDHLTGTEIVEFGIADITIVNQPKMPPATIGPSEHITPPGTMTEGIQEVTIDLQGHPINSVAKAGREAFVIWAQAWVMDWTFKAPILKGKPVLARFPLRMILSQKRK